MAKKNDKDTPSHESKIRGRVFSPDTSGSKMAALLADKGFSPRAVSKGEVVEGKIVALVSDSVLVDIGTKAEGLIPRRELEDSGQKTEIGEKISAVVAQTEGDLGTVILTVKRTVKEKVWEQLQDISDKNEIIDVKGISSNRGGLIVEYKGVRGFIPSSHLVTDAKKTINQLVQAKIIQSNGNLNKLVLSEKEAIGDSLPKVELPFKAGDTIDTKITKILPFGLLVSLPSGSDGLVHISEVSWRKVTSLQESYNLGQDIKAKIISIDPSSGKVNLSIKQLEPDPWQIAASKYKVGSTFERPVSRITSYGVFVQLSDGIEGLLHSSKIPYGLDLKPEEKIKVSVDLFNSEQRRVALRLATDGVGADNKKIAAPENASGVSRKKIATTEAKKEKETRKK